MVAVITQGVRVPADSRGDFKGFLFANDGFFQAAGVISFGKDSFFDDFEYIYIYIYTYSSHGG